MKELLLQLALIRCRYTNGSAEAQLQIIEAYIMAVNRMAENKMLATGKLEGSHHAAMKEVFEQLKKELAK